MAKTSYNMHEAKTHLSEIVEAVRAGQEIIVMNRSEPVARIIPYRAEKKNRRLNFMKGKIKLSSDWDQPLSDFKEYL